MVKRLLFFLPILMLATNVYGFTLTINLTNTTYPTSDIPLNISANISANPNWNETWVVYSLDGGNNQTFSFTIWQGDGAIISGLPDLGINTITASTIFYKSGTWYLIGGRASGVFFGYNWTGTTWQSDTVIASGLGDVGSYSKPTIFQKDGTWYLISGDHLTGGFFGYNWTGTTWQYDNVINSSLGSVGEESTPTVFQMDSTWYLISGEEDGIFNGYNWTGTTWQSDTVIASGLGDVGSRSASTIFQKDGTWYLISGETDGIFNGYNWTGTTWQSDTVIASGLGDVGVMSTPVVFLKEGTWYLISGEEDGIFNGYNWTYSTTMSALSEGSHKIEVFANTSIESNSSTIYFSVDSIYPNITITSPENKSYTDTTPNATLSVDETVNLSFTTDGWTQNLTNISSTYLNLYNLTSDLNFANSPINDTSNLTLSSFFQLYDVNPAFNLTFIGNGTATGGSLIISQNLSDDFADGDFTNNPTWTDQNADFDASNFYLEQDATNTPIITTPWGIADLSLYNWSWKFDVTAVANTNYIGICKQNALRIADGYRLYVRSGQNAYFEVDTATGTQTFWTGGDVGTAEHSYEINRTTDGIWEIWIDGGLNGTFTSTNFTACSYFGISGGTAATGFKIDNTNITNSTYTAGAGATATENLTITSGTNFINCTVSIQDTHEFIIYPNNSASNNGVDNSSLCTWDTSLSTLFTSGANINFSVDSGHLGILSSVQFPYGNAGFSFGSHWLEAYAIDPAGNENSSIVYFYVEDVDGAPDITLDEPVNGSSYLNQTVWVNITMDELNPSNVTVQINDENGSTYNMSLSNTSDNWNVEIFVSIGNHNITIFANDTSGNMSVYGPIFFSVDNVTVYNVDPLNGTNGSSMTTEFIFRPNLSLYNWDNATLHIGGDTTTTVANTSAISNGVNNSINYTFTSSGNYTWHIEVCTLEAGCINSSIWEFELGVGTITIEVYTELLNVLVNGTTYIALLDPDNYEPLYSGNATNGTINFEALGRDYILRAGKIGDAEYIYPRERPITITFNSTGGYTTYIYLPDTTDTTYNINFQKNDYTGCYRDNVTLELRKSINGTWRTIHKRQFDAAQIVWSYLIANEDYELRVDSPASCGGVRVLDFITAREAGTFYLDIGDIEYHPDLIKTSWADIYYRIYWDHDANAMRLEYNDTTDDTIGVNFYIYNGSNLSQLLYFTTVNSSYALVTYAGNENYTYLGVIEATTNTYGTGRFSDMVMKNLPVRRIDLGLPSDMAWLYTAISWIVIIFTAMLFGPKNSHVGGGIVTAQLLLFYYGFGWITFSSGRVAGFTISLVGLLALINILTKKREVAVR